MPKELIKMKKKNVEVYESLKGDNNVFFFFFHMCAKPLLVCGSHLNLYINKYVNVFVFE